MSDQNQWPKPDEQQPNGPDASQQPNPYSAPQAPQYVAPQQPNPYGGPQQPNPYGGPQQPNPYAQQPNRSAQQPNPYGQQPNPYAQQNPYAGPADYANTGYQPYGQRPKTSILAILSIVFGLGAIPFFFIAILLGPAGAILGHVALGKIRQTGEQGRGLALTGIIAGWVMTGVWILWIALVVFAIGHSGGYSDYGTDYGSDSGAFVS